MVQLLVLVFIALPAAISSFILESRRKRTAPQSERPYTWGFFQGMTGLLMGFYSLVGVVIASLSHDADPEAPFIWLVLAALWGPAGYFVIKRRKWAWIVHTIASLNPFWWIANTIYARNRWSEFEGSLEERAGA